MARADLVYDTVLNGMIETSSNAAEKRCRRKFAYAQRVEFYQSYEQDTWDPTPQYLWLDGPIDPDVLLRITWAWNEGQDFGQEVASESYNVDLEEGLIILNAQMSLPAYSNSPIPYGSNFVTSPTGFRVQYAGGYPVSAPPDVGYIPDPMDDYGVVQVPDGLKLVVAQKVASDFINGKVSTPWAPEMLPMLDPYRKKDVIG